MSHSPYVSFVAGARNDDHGGNLLGRMQIFIDALIHQCERHGLDMELLLVEWNPPQGSESLSEALHWPPLPPGCAIRILEVPQSLHDGYENSDKIPFHQFIAKNVGIRRAVGEFVVATNVDLLFSDELMAFIARRQLRHDRYYRVDRLDVSADIPIKATIPEQLAFCQKNVIRIHQKNGSKDLRTGTFNKIIQEKLPLRLATWGHPFGFLPFLILCLLDRAPGYSARTWIEQHCKAGKFSPAFVHTCWEAYGQTIGRAKKTLMIRSRFGDLHTNASGDFTMMARKKWKELGGYIEFSGFPMHVDGLILYDARLHGLTETVLAQPACVYHVEHGEGSGFEEYVSGEMWSRLDRKGIPRITPDQLRDWIVKMAEGKPAFPRDYQEWGLGGEVLKERVIAP